MYKHIHMILNAYGSIHFGSRVLWLKTSGSSLAPRADKLPSKALGFLLTPPSCAVPGRQRCWGAADFQARLRRLLNYVKKGILIAYGIFWERRLGGHGQGPGLADGLGNFEGLYGSALAANYKVFSGFYGERRLRCRHEVPIEADSDCEDVENGDGHDGKSSKRSDRPDGPHSPAKARRAAEPAFSESLLRQLLADTQEARTPRSQMPSTNLRPDRIARSRPSGARWKRATPGRRRPGRFAGHAISTAAS